MPTDLLPHPPAPDGGAEPAERPMSVVLADDHPLILSGLRHALGPVDDIEVIGEARSGTELIGMVDRRRPDLVLLDLHMPGADGITCIQHIKMNWPAVKTVVLSASDAPASIDAALEAGASAYIIKSVASTDVASVLRQAHSGAVFHAPSRAPSGDRLARERSAPDLTEREWAILEAIADGLTTRAISQELWISEHTVKFHLTNIYRKLGVSNRAAAVRCALELQLSARSA